MGLDSPLFLLVCLPALMAVYALTPVRLGRGLMLAASLAFYALVDARSLPVFAASIALNMLAALWMERLGPAGRKRVLALGVAANLGLLAYVKYSAFLLSQIPGLEALTAQVPRSLPLGVSFFTFSAVAYLVDVSRGECEAQRDVARFSLFMTFFPKITAGPIARYQQMFPPGAEVGRITLEGAVQGLTRFAVGLAKKTLVAGQLGFLADAAFGERAGNLDLGTAWLGLLCYTLQLYYDFSGYTDMAVGLGRIFGYPVPENFNYPYVSRSVREFWRRWHMTLSAWFRDYLYIPLGGGRGATWKVYRNLITVFALCGLWHGASWSFVVWGLWHGVFLVFERTPAGRALDRAPAPLRHVYCLLAVGLGWVFFRAPDFPAALAYFQALAGLGSWDFTYTWMVRVNAQLLTVLAVACLGAAPAVPWLRERLGGLAPLARSVAAPALLALSVMQLASGTLSPFIYAQF